MNGGAFSKASGIIVSANIAITAPAANESMAGDSVTAGTLNVEGAFSASLSVSWPDEAWWGAYGDPQLNELVRLAVAQSPTLRIAEARVRQASGAAQASGSGMLPGIRWRS